MVESWRAQFSVEGECWTSQGGVHEGVDLPKLFDVACLTYFDREPPDAKAHLLLAGMNGVGNATYPMIGFSLDLDPQVYPWTVTWLDLTSPTSTGNATIGLQMLEPLTWLTVGEQRTTATSGDFVYDVESSRIQDLWRLQAVPIDGDPVAPWLDHFDLDLRTGPAAQWPWDSVHIRLRTDARDYASLNGDLILQRGELLESI